MRARADVWTFAGAAALLVVISAWLAWHLSYAPDEGSHLTVVQHYAHDLGWMTRAEWQYGAQRGHGYNLLSPVPYVIYVPFQLLGEHLRFHGATRPDRFTARLGGMALVIPQLALTVAIARRMCRRCSRLEAIVVAFVANLIPQLRYIHSYVNADAMTIVAGTASLSVALRVLQHERITLTDATLVGLTLGLCAHARYNVFFVAAILLIVFGVRVVRGRARLHAKLRLAGVAVAIPLVLAGWFHLHVYNELQNRHVLATVDNEQLNQSTFKGKIATIPTQFRLGGVRSTWRTMWADFPRYVSLHGLWNWLLFAGFVLGAIGLVLPSGRILSRAGRIVGSAAIGALILTLTASPRLAALPGRFLLSAGVGALVGVILGTATLLDRVARSQHAVLLAAGTWGALLLGINLWAMVRVAG